MLNIAIDILLGINNLAELEAKPNKLLKQQNMSALQWIQAWYQSQCDGDWEHQHGITINTLDNPGWSLKIDISNTELENLELDYRLIEISDDDWYGFKADKYTFEAFGDPTKLETLIMKFKEIVDDTKEAK